MKEYSAGHDINPQDKTAAWYLAQTKNIWSNWQNTASRSFAGGIGRYNRFRYYSIGKQPIDQYKPQLGIDDKNNHTWMAIDMTPIPILAKLIRIINSLFRKVEMTPDVEAIDAYSEEDKTAYYEKEEANIQMRKILGPLGISDEILNNGDKDQPKTEEELEIHRQFTYKHSLAMKVEEALAKVFLDNSMDTEREKVRESLLTYGAGGYRIYTDEDGKVCCRSVDISAFMCSYTNDPLMTDLWYAGEVTFVLISELRQKLPNVQEKDLEELARKFSRQNGNPIKFGNTSSGSYSYDNARIPVLDLTFKTWNKIAYEKRTLKNGNFVLGKTDKAKAPTEKRTYYEDESVDVCTVKWILESDIVYDHCYENDMVKKASRYWDTTLPYIMAAPSLFKMETTSLVEECIPFVDAVHIAWYKLQNVIAQARPKGVQIEIGALEDVSLSGNGETMTPLQLIDLYSQKGIVVYRRIAADGTPSNYQPITELKNGIGEEAAEYFSIMEREINLIKSSVGLNDFTDGSTPDPKSLNGVANMAAEATNNALHHIFNAERNLMERLCDNAATRIYDSITFRKSTYYDASLGKSSLEKTIGAMKRGLREMGVKIRLSPTQAEKQKLADDVTAAVNAGQITIADKFAIIDITNVKQAQMVLAYRIKVNQEAAHQRELEKIKITTDQQKTSGIAVEEERRKTMNEEIAKKGALIDKEYQWKEKLLRLQLGFDSANQADEHAGKKEITQMNNDSSERAIAARHQPKAA